MREVLVFTTQLPLSELWSKVLGSKLVHFSYQKHILCLFLKIEGPGIFSQQQLFLVRTCDGLFGCLRFFSNKVWHSWGESCLEIFPRAVWAFGPKSSQYWCTFWESKVGSCGAFRIPENCWRPQLSFWYPCPLQCVVPVFMGF